MIHIHRGLLQGHYEPHNLPGASITVERRVYSPDGTAMTVDYHGPGRTLRIDGVLHVQIGHEHATTLRDYRIDEDPTPESDAYDAGYRAGFVRRRSPSAATIEGRSAAWIEGLWAGFAETDLGRRQIEARRKRLA